MSNKNKSERKYVCKRIINLFGIDENLVKQLLLLKYGTDSEYHFKDMRVYGFVTI